MLDGPPQGGVVRQQVGLAGDGPQGLRRGLALGLDAAEDAVPQGGVTHQVRIAGGDGQVHLGQHHVQVGEQGPEGGPLGVHLAQQVQTRLAPGCAEGPHRRAEAVPARQHEAALAPAEHPGDGPQVRDGPAALPAGGPGADVQAGDLGDGRGLPEVALEALGLEDQVPVGRTGLQGEGIHGLAVAGCAAVPRALRQAGLQGGGHQHLQVAAPHGGVAVLGGDDLTLLREADLPAHGPGGLGQDGLVGGSATAAHGATAAVEEAQTHAVAPGHGHQGHLGLVELPAGGEEAAVLVAVGVAQHDFLHAAAALQ